MHTIIQSLTSNGIQNMEVFFDTLVLNIKAEDYPQYFNYILIDRINFDYDTASIVPNGKEFLISFGDTEHSGPFLHTGTSHIDNVLLEKEKRILICGLSATMPIVYDYSINDNTLSQVYPTTDTLLQWGNLNLGDYNSRQRTLIAYNRETNILNYVIPTIKDGGYVLNDVEITYTSSSAELSNVRSLSGFDNSQILISLKNYNNDGEKLCITRKGTTIYPFKL